MFVLIFFSTLWIISIRHDSYCCKESFFLTFQLFFSLAVHICPSTLIFFFYLTSCVYLFVCICQLYICLSCLKAHLISHGCLAASTTHLYVPCFVPVGVSVWPLVWLNIHPCFSVCFGCLLSWPFPFTRSEFHLVCPPVILHPLSTSLQNCRPTCRSASLFDILPWNLLSIWCSSRLHWSLNLSSDFLHGVPEHTQIQGYTT